MKDSEKAELELLFDDAAQALTTTGAEGIHWTPEQVSKVAGSCPAGMSLALSLTDILQKRGATDLATLFVFAIHPVLLAAKLDEKVTTNQKAKLAALALSLMDEFKGPSDQDEQFLALGRIACSGGRKQKKSAEEKIVRHIETSPTQAGSEARLNGLYGRDEFVDINLKIYNHLTDNLKCFPNDERRGKVFLWAVRSQSFLWCRDVLTHWIKTLDLSPSRNLDSLKTEMAFLEESLEYIEPSKKKEMLLALQTKFTPEKGMLSYDQLYEATKLRDVKQWIVNRLLKDIEKQPPSEQRDFIVEWACQKTLHADQKGWCEGFLACGQFERSQRDRANLSAMAARARQLNIDLNKR